MGGLPEILVGVGAVVALYAALKKRLDIMMPALTVILVFQGILQLERGTPWLPYLSFAAAGIGLISTLIQLRRNRQANKT